VDQALGMNPAPAMLADIELTGVVADEHGVGEETTCGQITRSCTTKLVQPLKREPRGGATTVTVRSSWIAGRFRASEVSGGFGSVPRSMPLAFRFG
jgi:hypothetical protein